MKKQLSEQAQVAKLIRQYCKSIGVKCHAKSESFSMGDAVSWTVYDQPPAVYKQISDYAAKFQEGHFNGMEDIYEYSNNRDDLPQTKYCHGKNEFSDELKQAAWDVIRNLYTEAAEAPESFKDAGNVRIGNDWADATIWRFLNGSIDMGSFTPSADFWASRTKEAA